MNYSEPQKALKFFDIKENIINVSRIDKGLINETYLVKTTGQNYLLQKLHRVLKPSVLYDIHETTTVLHNKNITTPLLIKTLKGELGLNLPSGHWRVLTFISGICLENGLNTKQAYSAGRLLGKFHDTLSEHNYIFKHQIKNFHNTEKIITYFKKLLKNLPDVSRYNEIIATGRDMISFYEKMDKKINSLPNRTIHGDPKINNIVFTTDKKEALCLLDLDTLGKNKIILDIGDAARTWCNDANEDDIKNSKFNPKTLKQMVRGYVETARFVTNAELNAIVEGIETILIEQISRFLTDAIEESYYTLQKEKYDSLYTQNKTKAMAQVKLFYDFQNHKPEVIQFLNSLIK